VLLLAVSMPWIALHVPIGPTAVLAENGTVAVSYSQRALPGPSMDGIAWSSSGSLLFPAVPQTVVNPRTEHRDVIRYVARAGDTLRRLAARYNLSLETLVWSNPTAVDQLSPGEVVYIPPVDGVLVSVKPGDSVESLARRYRVGADAINQFNLLRDPQALTPGAQLMIPYGVGPEPPRTPKASASELTAGGRSWPISPIYSGAVGDLYPFGQCTWYVNTKRPAPWGGNAWQWYGRARAWGRPVGSQPRVGAIMVTWESPYWGHVAYVERVYPDGSWLVSEMNYYGVPGGGWGRVDYRHIMPGTIPLIGFIY
jgi:surface antigen/LysM repeat protein